jgi:hypothetical protein
MQQYLKLLGRDAKVVNLDPANESTGAGKGDRQLPYETILDVCEEMVNLRSVMEKTGLGPNGGLVFCMDYVESHAESIISTMKERLAENTYLLIDFPGQVELFTHSTVVQTLLQKLADELELRLCVVQLIDAQYCSDAAKFLSAALLGTTTMLRLELPVVNVLSKVDLLSKYGDLPMQFEFFTECHDLDRLVQFLDDPTPPPPDGDAYSILDDPDYDKARQRRRQTKLFRQYHKLHESIAEVVEDFGLLSFVPLDITSAESVGRVLARIDKCNGFVFTDDSANVNQDLFRCATTSNETPYDVVADIHERLSSS